MLLKNHRPSNELKAQGRSLSPGSEPWAVCQVHEQKPPHITPFPVDSPHCPTAKQSLRSAHSRPAPLLLWECWHLLAVNWPPCLRFHPYYTSFIHSYIRYLVHSTPTMCQNLLCARTHIRPCTYHSKRHSSCFQGAHRVSWAP